MKEEFGEEVDLKEEEILSNSKKKKVHQEKLY